MKSVVKIIALIWIFSSQTGWGQAGHLITAFTNPVPSQFALFGWSVAALGSNRVLIGAPADDTGAGNAGVVYLFSTNGSLLTTFTNPVPSEGFFGGSLTVVGDNAICIGPYLFNTNGLLLTTFTNPSPNSDLLFGSSVAAMGGDRVLIGAPLYVADTTTNRGFTFLFGTNGALLTTIGDPRLGHHMFGRSVAVVFNDKLLVGAPHTDPNQVNAGAAYLFNTNGTLLMSFTNPAAASFDNFGFSVAAVGDDRALISALSYSAVSNSSGVVYMFNSNGTLLATITQPSPEPSAQFGSSVAVVDNNQVLIGAPLDDAWTRAGAAFLFSTNGNPLVTFTNPMTSQFSNQYLEFGRALTAVGGNAVIVGSPSDDTGDMNAGAAYLFSIPPPLLKIRLTETNTVAVSWLSPAPRCMLQANTNGIETANWSNVTAAIQDDGTNRLFITAPFRNTFYRLFRP